MRQDEGYLALDGTKPTELTEQFLYGVNRDMTMGYLSNMVWCLTFQKGTDDHARIDYGKYINGDEDYICHDSCLKEVGYTEWDKIS